jgi:hypothetical protein
LWGAPRIHGELLKLGAQVSQATVAKYMVRSATPSQPWRTFLANHVQQLVAAGFFVVPTATCRLLFVLVLLAHERRRIVHLVVTPHPTVAWTAQQFREAFPWDQAPRRLKRLRSDCAVRVSVAIRAVVGILARHSHTKVDTTINVYTQVLDGAARDAATQVGSELARIVRNSDPPTTLTH